MHFLLFPYHCLSLLDLSFARTHKESQIFINIYEFFGPNPRWYKWKKYLIFISWTHPNIYWKIFPSEHWWHILICRSQVASFRCASFSIHYLSLDVNFFIFFNNLSTFFNLGSLRPSFNLIHVALNYVHLSPNIHLLGATLRLFTFLFIQF